MVDRLDAMFYLPALMHNEERLLSCGLPTRPLSALVSNGRRVIYVGTKTLDHEAAPPDWVRWVTSDDMVGDGFFLSTDTTSRVSPAFAAKYANGRLRAGELLVKVKGPQQLAAYVPDVAKDQTVLVSGTIWGAIVRTNVIDPWYLTAVLEAPYGRIARARRRTNLNVEFVAPSDLVGVQIPEPGLIAQGYIGNKVRQAETLRARARTQETAFESCVGVDVPPLAKAARFSRLVSTEIGSDLNPGRYDPDRLQVRTTLLSSGGVELASFACIQTPTAAPTSPTQSYVGLDGIFSACVDLTIDTVATAEITGTCRRLLPGAAISKLRPYLNKVAYISGDITDAVGSTELLCVESSSVHPGFVYGVLKLDTTVRQLNPVATGATHPRVSSNDVLEVVVPMHDDHERLGRSLETAQQQYRAARRLTEAARLLVEALIERKVSEKELIAAHNDPAADRALLARLSGDGLDGEGAPLFVDLDRLDALLAEAAEGDDG